MRDQHVNETDIGSYKNCNAEFAFSGGVHKSWTPEHCGNYISYGSD